MQILIVEDDKAIRSYLSALITHSGHTAQEACNGHEAIEYVLHNHVDLVLMDLFMPGLDGIGATKVIRKEIKEWLPIIFISANTDERKYAEALSAGGDGFLTKPINGMLVVAQIRAMQRIVDMKRRLQAMNVKLEDLNKTDMLTQTPNRNAMVEYAERCIRQAKRKHSTLSALIIDIDFFKQLNDCYGHLEGDHCLKKVANTLKSTLKRPSDFVCRYGGEEFVVLLPETDAEGAEHTAQALCNAVEEQKIPHIKSSISEYVTISIGCYCSCGDQALPDLDAILKRADDTLYLAKQSGRNQIQLYSSLSSDKKNA